WRSAKIFAIRADAFFTLQRPSRRDLIPGSPLRQLWEFRDEPCHLFCDEFARILLEKVRGVVVQDGSMCCEDLLETSPFQVAEGKVSGPPRDKCWLCGESGYHHVLDFLQKLRGSRELARRDYRCPSPCARPPWSEVETKDFGSDREGESAPEKVPGNEVERPGQRAPDEPAHEAAEQRHPRVAAERPGQSVAHD